MHSFHGEARALSRSNCTTLSGVRTKSPGEDKPGILAVAEASPKVSVLADNDTCIFSAPVCMMYLIQGSGDDSRRIMEFYLAKTIDDSESSLPSHYRA